MELPDWNKPARDFYESLGAEAQSEWIGYRMSGKTLMDFARAHSSESS